MTQMYKVTGKYYNSKRNFRAIHTTSYHHARGINLWRGTVWECDAVGYNCGIPKWKVMWRVWN